ncbi:hypothetical protein HYU06_05790 [Candidatus Woesearchaeota archaeon]|nr:hypothetical protein [Candidatus Woesearchaeota archaeon]
MSVAAAIRNTVRRIITKYGDSVSHYALASATKTTNDEGEDTVTDWGTAQSIKAISSNHYAVRTIVAKQGLESNLGDRTLLIRDDVTTIPAQNDRIVIGSLNYRIEDIKTIDPIEDTTIAYRLVISEE